MKKLLLSFIIALLVLSPASAKQRLLGSVQLLLANGRARCTVFAINEEEKLWATAKHCLIGYDLKLETEPSYSIGGGYAHPIYAAPAPDDVAILKAELAGRALELAKEAPELAEQVRIVGHPYGLPQLVITEGIIAAKNVPLSPKVPISDILDVTVAGGNSGSPVLDKRGKVVGLLWGKFTRSNHSLSVPWETLKKLVGEYFDER